MVDEPIAPPASITEHAAHGHPGAFRSLAASYCRLADTGAMPGHVALAQAAVYSRLAMIRGDRDEAVQHLFVLEQYAFALRDAGHDGLANITHGEAIALAEVMGEAGDDEIGDLVIAAADTLEPGVLLEAGKLRDFMVGLMADKGGKQACSE